MTKSFRRFAASVLVAVLAAGCSGGGGGEEEAAENPKQAFGEALEVFADYDGFTFVISLEADPADISSADTPEAAAEAIVDSSVTISVKGNTAEDSQAEITFDIDGNEDAVQLRVVDESIYARAEVRDLVEAFEGDMAAIDLAVQQASASGFDFAPALADGEWIGVEGLGDLAEQFGLPQTPPGADEASAMTDRIVGILEKNARVTSEGTDDTGAHLVVTVPLKETASELYETLQSFGGMAAAGALPAGGVDEIPDADIPIDVWISDGRLVQIEVDIVTIAQELGESTEDVDELVFRMAIDEFDGEVEAPADFVEIDLQQIMQGIFGAALGGVESGSTGIKVPEREVVLPELGLACSDLEMFSPAEIESFLGAAGQPGAVKKVRQECPELF